MKTVVITGATSGTGYCVAKKFADNGYNVCITSRDEERAKMAAAKLKQEAKEDVETFGYGIRPLEEQQVIDMFNDLKGKGCPVSKLVLVASNMGINMPDFFEVKYEDWIRVINTNVGWNFMMTRQAAKHMASLGGGSIVIIGSANATRPSKNRSAYCVSKAGLHGLAKTLSVELGHLNIRVNTVVAGPIKTERYYARPEIHNSPQMKNPMGDIASFEDIANAVYFLADNEQARIISGAELAVDGALTTQFVYEEQGIKFADGTMIAD